MCTWKEKNPWVPRTDGSLRGGGGLFDVDGFEKKK